MSILHGSRVKLCNTHMARAIIENDYQSQLGGGIKKLVKSKLN
jgi:hypothetical protein